MARAWHLAFVGYGRIRSKTLEIFLALEDQEIAVKDNVVSGNKRKRLRKQGGSALAGRPGPSVKRLR